MSDTNEILATLQSICREKYPDISEALVEEILKLEEGLIDDQAQALRRFGEIVEAAVREQFPA